jgi:hypothetical protein
MEASQSGQLRQVNEFYTEQKTVLFQENPYIDVNENKPVYQKLAAAGCVKYFAYIHWLGLADDPGLIVLPSDHHFFYEAEDLKEVKTIVNQKELNYLKNIKDFIYSISCNLAHKSFFIGSFFEGTSPIRFFPGLNSHHDPITGKHDKEMKEIISGNSFFKMTGNLIGFKSSRYLTRRAVRLLLEDSYLKLVDMTEIKRLTYFCVQKTVCG